MQALQTAATQVVPNASSAFLLQRKCACGRSAGLTGAYHECRGNGVFAKPGQTELRMNASGDEYERQAERVAGRIVKASAHDTAGEAAAGTQRFAAPPNGSMIAAPDSVERVLGSPGGRLDAALRQDMERRFGHDFSRVRVHTDAAAEKSARDVAARAYTAGRNIVFGAGQYAPRSHEGRRLIAHELTHVVQQSAADAQRVGQNICEAGLSSSPSLAHEAPAVPRGRAYSTVPVLLMRQPEQKSETEPEASRTDETAAKTAPADPCTAPDPQLPVYKEADQKQRDQILQDMLRGLTATEKDSVCKRFRRALAAFSTSQMLTMKSAGVRFWRAGEFPPPFKDDYAPGKAKRNEMARYHPEVRVIQWGTRAGVDEIRHELAHAWDHVRGGKVARLTPTKEPDAKRRFKLRPRSHLKKTKPA